MHERREHPVVIACRGENRRRIVSIRFVELIVIILRFAEAIDDVAEQERELRNFFRIALRKVAHEFIGDVILCFRPDGASAIA